MIDTQIIKNNDIPVAVIMDYEEYMKLNQKAEDFEDYKSAVKTKMSNKKWISHENLISELGL